MRKDKRGGAESEKKTANAHKEVRRKDAAAAAALMSILHFQ